MDEFETYVKGHVEFHSPPVFECDRCGYRARQSRRPSQCEGCGTLTGTFTEHE